MSQPNPTISVKVDVANPGQFFACCGLLEFAGRRWPGAEGWFDQDHFHVADSGTLRDLVDAIVDAQLDQCNPDDHMASPMHIGAPFGLRLDWWTDEHAGGRHLKVWAGTMDSFRIARAMRQAMRRVTQPERLLDFAGVVKDPDNPKKKVEPYYFDSRRGANAQALDIGFAPDKLKMTTAAYPAVEFLCLVGLQRCRPSPTDARLVFVYTTWGTPLPANVAPAAVCGAITTGGSRSYRFRNAFRAHQKKHKSFLSATSIGVES